MPTCHKCNDTGVFETGNNDLPCSCPAGGAALFNQAGVKGPVSGAEMRRHFMNNSPEPIEMHGGEIPASSLPGRPTPNKWAEFTHPTYHIVDAGRTAAFLIPINKLYLKEWGTNVTFEMKLSTFLRERFSGFTVNPIPRDGVWVDSENRVHVDRSIEYLVSFPGKERIVELFAFLSEIAKEMGEQCLLVRAGQYDGLLYPS
jgi:hypothetical protein